jgi:hypothetical protein
MEIRGNQGVKALVEFGKFDLFDLRCLRKNTQIKLISNSMNNHNEPNKHLNNQLIQACKDGDLEKVRYLLTSPELVTHADINCKDGDAFTTACDEGHLHIIKYLLTSEELKEKVNINDYIGLGFVIACEYNHTHLVKYFLTSSDLEKSADIHTYNNYALRELCKRGHLDLLKYLTTSNEINSWYEEGDWPIGFKEACNQKQYNILRFFIFNLGYEVCEEDWARLPLEVKRMFELRKLNAKLTVELKVNELKNKIVKI